MSNIEKAHKKMYKLILSSCNIEDLEKINQYIEDDKKRLLNQDFNIEPDCNDDNIFVKRYVELYRCKVFDNTICKYDDDAYDMDKLAIIISPLYYAEKLLVKKYNELSLAAKQQQQTQPIDLGPTEFPKIDASDFVPAINLDNTEGRSVNNESKEEGSIEEL